MKAEQRIEYISDFKLCDKDHFLILKGISIILVVLAHLCDRYWNMPQFLPLQTVAAAVFLLCSGYGVSESQKNKMGLPHYWENKAIKIWLPSVVVMVLTGLLQRGDAVSWIGENPLALYGWFLYLLFGQYLIFWLAFTFLYDDDQRVLAIFAVSVLAFIILSKHEMAAQMLCFPVGVLFSQMGWRRSVREFGVTHQVLLCAVPAAIATGAYFLAGIVPGTILTALCWQVFALCAAAALCFVVYFARRTKIFGVFIPVGMISFALYLLHESVFALLVGFMEGTKTLAVLFVLLVIATVFQFLMHWLYQYNKKLRRRKSTRIKGVM